jgi:F0F1-type ATP synthase epsilon subunit
MGKRSEDPALTVNAASPFHVYYEGPALAVSAFNKVGPFDILPGHSSFFSVLKNGEVIIDTGKELVNFNISNGFISVRNNVVELFANI